MNFFLVYESFKEYVTPEKLEGDNKYDAGEYGMQVNIIIYSFINIHLSIDYLYSYFLNFCIHLFVYLFIYGANVNEMRN